MAANSPAATEVNPTNDDPLAHLRPNHPRLLFTDEDLAKALAAAKTDPLRAELNKHIIATAEAILHALPIRQPDRAQGQEQERYAVYNILTCAMAYRLTNDERFFTRAKNDLLTCAAFPDWSPKHFLSVAEMSFASAIGYDWLYAKLTPDERAIIKKGYCKILFPSPTRYTATQRQKTPIGPAKAPATGTRSATAASSAPPSPSPMKNPNSPAKSSSARATQSQME